MERFSNQDLEKAFSGAKPGIAAHDKVMSIPRPTVEEVLESNRSPRLSAVVFLLYPRAGEWCFLLLKRHDYKGVHSGQVGLPGGALEEGESSESAAVRELEEETGIRLNETSLITQLTHLYIPPSNFIVTPYVAILDESPVMDYDAVEVKRGMEIKLNDLIEPGSLQDTTVKISEGDTRLKVKAFGFEGETVWGATAMILSECKQILETLAR